ncbi:uncharacterized protein [Coffea arabica]|uniref:ZCF37 n=1 Tax=Coffea arabica TaxID=13443 RepID=A0A6P6UWU0_COFAR|nr:uncharacterized protein LOC113715170 [Coffea arabica]
MCSPFSCGSFKNQERDDFDEFLSPRGSPSRSKSAIHDHRGKRRDSKNPYANQGLDKFHALLAELEDKKKKIYTQKGSNDISFVYFTDSNSNNSKSDEWKPIIVKVKRQENTGIKNAKDKQMMTSSEAGEKHSIEASRAVGPEVRQPKEEPIQRPKAKSWNWRLVFENWRHTLGFLPVTVVLILLFLLIYGKSFAILCTTLGWYLVPLMKGKSSSSERHKKKNEHLAPVMQEKSSSSDIPKKKNRHVRRYLSEKNMANDGSPSSSSAPSSPDSVLSGPAEKTPTLHGHRKSWS